MTDSEITGGGDTASGGAKRALSKTPMFTARNSARYERQELIKEINEAINAVDQSTQQTASTVEEANAASQSLADEAEGLSNLIKKFRVRSGHGQVSNQPRKLRRAS